MRNCLTWEKGQKIDGLKKKKTAKKGKRVREGREQQVGKKKKGLSS